MPEAETKKIMFAVEGMRCASCSVALERELSALDGVVLAQVNLAANTASVSYDPTRLGAEEIFSAVKRVGFTPVSDTDGEAVKKNKIKGERRALGRLIFALAFSIPLFVVSMGHMLGLRLPDSLSPDKSPLAYSLLLLALCLPVLCAGGDIFKNGLSALARRRPGMDTLVSVGSAASFLFSVYSLIRVASGDFQAVHELYFESSGMIITVILLGRALESRGRAKTGRAVELLMSLVPETAEVERGGVCERVAAESVEVGETVLVKPGMSVPVDGTVIFGSGFIDESMLTGESVPAEKTEGDVCFNGTACTDGFIKLRAEKTAAESSIARVAQMVSQAQSGKAPVARLADKISGRFVPAVLIIALISGVAWLLSGAEASFAVRIFVSVLVISCPCALGLATPTAVMAAMGNGASRGILFKSGEALENLCKAQNVVFDKTGTLTEGKPSVTDIAAFDCDENELSALAASVEAGSSHPLARALTEAASGLEVPEARDFSYLTGRGISASVGERRVLLGNAALMEDNGIDISEAEGKAQLFSESGKTVVFLAADGKYLGAIALSDKIKPDSREAVAELKRNNIKTVMLTGDSEKTAQTAATELGIDSFRAELLPADKTDAVKQLMRDGGFTVMAGDGINDAPALAAADIGAAVGTGTDIAIDCADVILMSGSLIKLGEAIMLSGRTMRIIKQNLFWAFFYNCLGIPVAAGVLYALGGPLINPMLAAAAMSLSSICVVSNSLRLTRSSRAVPQLGQESGRTATHRDRSR